MLYTNNTDFDFFKKMILHLTVFIHLYHTFAELFE